METEKYRGLKIAAAVSGGMDSMAMLDMLLGAGLNVVRIINFEHGLRGEDSVADSEFVRRYAEERGVKCDVVKLDVKALSARDGIGDEEARKLRYAYFEELLSSGAADAVATAHHMDDNAETVMQRIFRGTGIRGLKGITDRPGYIHPLSDMTRAEIERYVREKNIPFCTDKTNLESVYTRNYIRNEIFPVIERRFPGFKRRIARLAETARETDDLLESLKTPGVRREGGIFLPSEAFAAHPAIVKKSISDALRMLGIYRDVEKRHLDDVMRLASAATGGRAKLVANVTTRYKELNFTDFMSVEVNGAPYETSAKVPSDGSDHWTVPTAVELGVIDLTAGAVTEVKFTVITPDDQISFNFYSLEVVREDINSVQLDGLTQA